MDSVKRHLLVLLVGGLAALTFPAKMSRRAERCVVAGEQLGGSQIAPQFGNAALGRVEHAVLY